MKTSPSVESSRRFFRDLAKRIAESRFFRDRLSMTLIAVAVTLNATALVWLLLRVRPTDVPVPVRYSNLLSGFDQLGPWYFPFLIVAYGFGVTLINTWFAYYSFSRSRIVTFFLLSTACVVAAFSFIVAAAFGVVR